MHPDFQARIRIVQSPANRWLKTLRAAVRRPPALGERGALLAVEGPVLLEEALNSGWEPEAVFFSRGAFPLEGFQAIENRLHPSTELLQLPPELFRSAVETEAPRGIAALLPAPDPPPNALPQNALLLVLAGIQDPGNVGTLLRAAEAFAAHGAVFLSGTSTPWNGKALRASAGSAFRVHLHALSGPAEASEWLRAQGVRSFAAVARGGAKPDELPLARAAALWVGNEGAGLSPEQIGACDARITLPMSGSIESLNAAIAGSILLYEAARCRTLPPKAPRA